MKNTNTNIVSKASYILIDMRCYLFLFVQIVIIVLQSITLRYSGEGIMPWCQNCMVFISLNFMLQIVFFCMNRSIFSLGSLFLACSYLVNCSFCVLLAFGMQDADSALMLVHLPRFGVSSFVESTLFSLNCISSVAAGYFAIAGFSRQDHKSSETRIAQSSQPNLLLALGSFLSVIFGALYFASTIIMVVASVGTGDYSTNSQIVNLPFMSEALSLQPFFFTGLFLLMAHYKQEGRLEVSRKIMLFAVLCLVFSFLSGVRSRGTMQLLVLLVLWARCIEKPNAKTVVAWILIGVILLQFMAAIRSVRKGDLSILSIASAFFSLGNSLIYEVLNEYGSSLFVTAGFINWVSETHPMDFVIKQIGSILPGVSSWGGGVFLPPAVSTGFENIYHLGSTYVADLYYYFGLNGSCFAATLGIWIAYLDKLLERWSRNGGYLQIAVMLPCILSVFNCTRASMDFGFKMLVYSAVIFLVATMLMNRGSISVSLSGDIKRQRTI